jgi:hypothetical protein
MSWPKPVGSIFQLIKAFHPGFQPLPDSPLHINAQKVKKVVFGTRICIELRSYKLPEMVVRPASVQTGPPAYHLLS